MRKHLRTEVFRISGICMLVLLMSFGVSNAQTAKVVTIRDLNSYTSLSSQDDIPNQYYADSLVTFTAVVSSYPKDSGLASYTSSNDAIDRIHVFVTDTSAASMGRDGMSMQIVNTDYSKFEDLKRGDVITVTGTLTFFGPTAQFGNIQKVTNISLDLTQQQRDRYAQLIKPIDVNVADLNDANPNGTMQLNLPNYSKYIGSYVKITNATVVNVSLGDRPNWALKQGDNLIYIYDTSLRVRNDRSTYRTGYNYRHGADGNFEPPPAGSVVNVSGYITLNTDDPDAKNASGLYSFTINPYDDGYVWLNGTRYKTGDQVGGQTLDWPNDIEIVSSPPSFTNYTVSSHTPTSTEQVTVSVDVTPNNAGATLSSVNLVYNDGSGAQTVAMSNSTGSTYTYTFPTYANYKSVSFHIEATDSKGITGVYPQGEEDSFIVLDQEINKISLIQKTSDGMPGPSPLAGVGEVPMNITATIVADSTDGFIIAQDAADPWSGVFLDATAPGVKSLKKGDKINITKGIVKEDYSVTYLNVTQMNTISTGNDYSNLIPSLITQDITNNPAHGEPYEGMLLKFNDVKITASNADAPGGDYGEFEFGSRQGGGAADTVKVHQGLRVDDGVNEYGTSPASRDVQATLNENIISGAQISSITGAMYYTYGNDKLILRSLSDVVSTEWTTPIRTISLSSPADGADVTVDHDLTVQWGASQDYDGDKVHYIWALSTPADTTFKNPLLLLNSDNAGLSNSLTITFKKADSVLAAAGKQVGDNINLIWSILMTDGTDTVQTSTYSTSTTLFTPVYNKITLTRATDTPIEKNNGIPHKFALDQNYPNPFNPTTNIHYSLPKSSRVTLTVYDLLGRTVAVLVNKVQSTGAYTINFDASRLSSGMYFYRLEAAGKVMTRKMVLIK